MTAFDGELNLVTTRPCNECPFRKTALPGWLGPLSAEDWVSLLHSDAPIACHMTIDVSQDWEGASQCAGAANMRRALCKLPRDRTVARGEDDPTVFQSSSE